MIIFHLAIPAKNLEDSKKFYMDLGAVAGRETDQSVIINLYGLQLVLHKSLNYDKKPAMYPRHFGLIIDNLSLLLDLWGHVQNWEGHVFAPLFVRNNGLEAEHQTFFLKDPSNNLIEFKWYKNPTSIYPPSPLETGLL